MSCSVVLVDRVLVDHVLLGGPGGPRPSQEASGLAGTFRKRQDWNAHPMKIPQEAHQSHHIPHGAEKPSRLDP